MAWWDDILGSIGGAASQAFDSAAPTQLRDQALKWMGYFAANAVTACGPNVLDPEPCDFCSELGVVDCQVCGARTCLAHSFVNHKAEAVCFECVSGVVGTKVDQKRMREQQKFRRRAEKATRKPGADERLVVALKELGLEKGAAYEDVKAAHRYLVLKHHPDRVKSDAAKERAGEKLKKINAAFAVLKTHYERAA